eukprot:10009181-Alexandrium_andersonii.AAC.1
MAADAAKQHVAIAVEHDSAETTAEAIRESTVGKLRGGNHGNILILYKLGMSGEAPTGAQLPSNKRLTLSSRAVQMAAGAG